MITDNQYAAWLRSNTASVVILVEATHGGGTEYIASRPFVSQPSDTPANTVYDDVLIGDIDVDDNLGAATIGEILCVNDGGLDGWLDNNWRGYALRIYVGDVNWVRDDFRLVIDGINGGIEEPQSDRLAFVFYDRSELLRVSVGSALAPINLGITYNVTPALIDAALLKYKVHDGAVTAITVRDNGVEITPTLYLENGEFTLTAQAAGHITCDVDQADQTVSQIVTELCSRIGVAVDAANLAAFSSTAILGFFVNTLTTAESLIADILRSVGGSYRFNNSGELQVFKLDAPAVPGLHLIADDIALRGLNLTATEQPTELMTLGYKRNWSVQPASSLAGSLSAAEKASFEAGYLTVEHDNNLANNPLAIDDRVDTLIANQADAQTECDRRAALRSVQRNVYRADCFLPAIDVFLGQTINLSYPRFGFENGADFVVIAIGRLIGKNRVELQLWA